MAFNFTGGTGKRQRSSVLVVVLLVVSLACMGMYMREGDEGILHSLQYRFSALAGPAKTASGAISAAEDNTADAMANTGADESTLTGLREQNQQLRETIAQLEEYRQEAQRLQELLKISDLYDADSVTARVLSRSLDPWNLIVTIDKGGNDGVRAGLPVLGPSGLVGQVVAATATTAEVRLLQDPQSGVSVVIQSSRVEGIVRGNLDGVLYLEDVDDDAEVKPGDVVITSGLGGGYFQGIMVGTVSNVEGEVGTASRRIVVDANTQARAFEEVMVVTAMRSGVSLDSASTSEGSQNATAQNTSATSETVEGYSQDDSEDYSQDYTQDYTEDYSDTSGEEYYDEEGAYA